MSPCRNWWAGARKLACPTLQLLLLFAAAQPARAAAPAPTVWEILPYRIQFMLVLAPEPELTPALRQRIEARVLERAERSVGSAWNLFIEPPPTELQAMALAPLRRLGIDDLPESLVESDFDKLLVAVVRLADGGYEIEARDYDLHARLASSPVLRVAPQRELLPDEVVEAVLLAFSPLARIDDVEEKQVTLKLRAGALPPIDPSISFTQPGDVFRAVRRFNDREGKLKKLMNIDWTYLVVERVDETDATCEMFSGLRSPLTGRSRGRDERLALLVRPTGGATQLELHSRMLGDDPKTARPLAGYAIYAHPAGSPETVLVGRTNGDGKLLVPSDATPVRILLVKHGGEPLARLPIMPGLEPVMQAEVADDDVRLVAEGIIVGIQERLVDLIARRQVTVVRIRARLEENKIDEAKALLEELRLMGRQEDYINEVRVQKQQAVSDDKRMQKKIDKLFDDTEQVIIRYLNTAEIEKLEREISAKEKELKGGK
ncbi:MAG TPA: hypothetical protein VFI31_27285 [Pirellulales bacterium]|nr:hypothetical protein [Pirellulales bacterium]